MSRSSTLILTGVLTLVVSFIGLPLAWLHVLLPIFGAIAVVIGVLIRTDKIAAMKSTMPTPLSPDTSPNELSPIA